MLARIIGMNKARTTKMAQIATLSCLLCCMLLLSGCTTVVYVLGPPQYGDPFVADNYEVTRDIPRTVKSFAHLWAANKIVEVQVLNKSTNVETRVPVSTQYLESRYNYKLIYRQRDDLRAQFDELVSKIKSAHATPSGTGADLRWGFVFCNKFGQRMFSCYFDKDGREGVIDDCCVKFGTNDLAAWATAKFGTAFWTGAE